MNSQASQEHLSSQSSGQPVNVASQPLTQNMGLSMTPASQPLSQDLSQVSNIRIGNHPFTFYACDNVLVFACDNVLVFACDNVLVFACDNVLVFACVMYLSLLV